MDLRELLAEAVGGVPEAQAGRCVHERAEVASCRHCVTSCPRDAWILDDEELAIDTGQCDGCGLCVAHCPEGALSQPGSSLAVFAARPQLALSCEHAAADSSDCRLPCVNAVALQQIALLYRNGLRRLGLYTGDCAGCPRRDDDGLVHQLALFNQMLRQRGLTRIDVELGEGRSGRPGWRAAGQDASAVQLSRRGFLRSLAGAVAQAHGSVSDAEWRPVGRYLPPARRGDLALHVPRIDAACCNGCDACVRVCPHGALSLSAQGEAYLVAADSCTGCRLCEDVCDQQAVSVMAMARIEQMQVPLQGQRCRACGAPFHLPASQGTDAALCHVCTRVNHQRKLFQVL